MRQLYILLSSNITERMAKQLEKKGINVKDLEKNILTKKIRDKYKISKIWLGENKDEK